MRRSGGNKSIPVLGAILVLSFALGCEGDVGPMGPAGPQGPTGTQGQDAPGTVLAFGSVLAGEVVSVSGPTGVTFDVTPSGVLDEVEITGSFPTLDMGAPVVVVSPSRTESIGGASITADEIAVAHLYSWDSGTIRLGVTMWRVSTGTFVDSPYSFVVLAES